MKIQFFMPPCAYEASVVNFWGLQFSVCFRIGFQDCYEKFLCLLHLFIGIYFYQSIEIVENLTDEQVL